MSSAYLKGTNGSVGPTVPTLFITDFQEDQVTPVGNAIPAGHELEILGGSGISTYVDPNDGNRVFIKIKNSTTDTGQTVDAQTIVLSTFDCTIPGTYKFTTEIAGYSIAGTNGAGVTLYTTVISDGANVTVIGDSDPIAHISVPIMNVDYEIVGNLTNAELQITGQAGFTINWGAISIYVFRGA